MKFHFKILYIILLCYAGTTYSQDRFQTIETKLIELAKNYKGLRQPVEISVTGISIQEFVRALSINNDLNIAIDPSLNYIVYNNFSNETPINIILFLCKQYNLDIEITGTIIYLRSFEKVPEQSKAKEIPIKYNPFTQLISMELLNDTLRNVVKEIVNQSKKNIILSPGLDNKTINTYLQDVTVEASLKNIAFANNLNYEKSDENTFLLTVTQQTSGNSNNNYSSSPSQPYTPYTKFRNLNLVANTDSVNGTESISITAFDIPINEVIQVACDKLKKNYFIYSDIKGNISLTVKEIPFEKLLNLLFNNTTYTYRSDNSIYMFGDRSLEQIRTSKVYQLKYRSSKDMEMLIPSQYRNNIEIKPFVELNSIVISGSAPQIKEIEAFLEQIDRQVPMIHIEVIVMDVRKGRTVTSGVAAGISDKPVPTQGAILPGLNFTLGSGSINDLLSFIPGNKLFNIGKVNTNFYLSLNAMEQNENIKIYSTPHLSTLNGHEASLKIGEKAYYAIDQRDVIGNQNPQTVFTRTYQETNADLKINITPMVSADDNVTMVISVEDANFTNPTVAGAPPGLSTRLFKSEIRVKNEDMVILGGLHRDEKSNTGSGLPLLSRIPVLRWFFGNRKKVKMKSQLVIFIKPTIVY